MKKFLGTMKWPENENVDYACACLRGEHADGLQTRERIIGENAHNISMGKSLEGSSMKNTF